MKSLALAFILIFLVIGCEEEIPESPVYVPETQFELEKSRGGITGSLQPFPLIHSSVYFDIEDYPPIRDEELVLMMKAGGQVYVYPYKEMYVEIVNEDFGSGPIAITFCPLTRSGIGWKRTVESDTLVLTASGYLLYDNMLAVDTVTETLFFQMHSIGYDGLLSGKQLENIPLIETTWETVRTYFGDAKIFDAEESLALSGVKSFQNTDHYQRFKKEDSKKQFGLFDIKGIQLFDYEDFPGELSYVLASGRGSYTMIGSEERRFITGFKSNIPLVLVEDSFPIVVKDSDGSQYDIFGQAVSGPNIGTQLETVNGYVAYVWAWNEFFPETLEH